MNGTAEVFELHRPRLFGVAYRMLGTRADAEDVLQDAYLRWHETATTDIQSPIGFLISITTRLCLDRLRSLKKEREQCNASWLSESIVEDYAPSPETQSEIADEISVAFLAVLERLGPEERVVFLLREVFDYDYPEVARIVGKSECACRQLVHRALPRVREAHSRFVVAAESRERLLAMFHAAVGTGDREAVMSLLAEKVEYLADGGHLAIKSWRDWAASQISPLVRLPVGKGNSDVHGRKRRKSGAGRSDARNYHASGPAD